MFTTPRPRRRGSIAAQAINELDLRRPTCNPECTGKRCGGRHPKDRAAAMRTTEAQVQTR